MSETLLSPPLVDNAPVPQSAEVFFAQREELLRQILDPPIEIDKKHYGYGNYEYARDAGLLDMFYVDPETGEDGLLHMLVGEARKNAQGLENPEGYHLAGAPELIGRGATTYVDRKHLEDGNAKHRARYVRRPFEPNKEQVVIQNFQKGELKVDEHGNTKTVPVDNSMFPPEYDALTAMQAVRQALNSRVKSLDQLSHNNRGHSVIVVKGLATMLDGKTPMLVGLILDAETEKVMTAHPYAKASGYMKLSETAVRSYLGL